MSKLINNINQVPSYISYLVICIDTFLSNWGESQGKDNICLFPCQNYNQARVVAGNAKRRSEMRSVSIIKRSELTELDTDNNTYSLFDYSATSFYKNPNYVERGTVPQSWRKGWVDMCSDVSWEDYHGMWGIQESNGNWYVIRWNNMVNSCGERASEEMGFTYEAVVFYVDFKNIDRKQLCDAMGYVDTKHCTSVELAYALVSYGSAERQEVFTSNKQPKQLRAQAKRYCEESLD